MTTTDRSGIVTVYKSTRFRSRLEARWAAFFDLIRWSWVYEPFDTGNWIPDFLIQGKAPFLVEVGPCVTEDDFRSKSAKPLEYGDLPTLVVGVAPAVLPTEYFTYSGYLVNETPGFAGHAFWTISDDANSIGIYQDSAVHYPHRTTWETMGHLDPDQELWMEQIWRRAGNEVQWLAHGPERIDSILLRGAAR